MTASQAPEPPMWPGMSSQAKQGMKAKVVIIPFLTQLLGETYGDRLYRSLGDIRRTLDMRNVIPSRESQ